MEETEGMLDQIISLVFLKDNSNNVLLPIKSCHLSTSRLAYQTKIAKGFDCIFSFSIIHILALFTNALSSQVLLDHHIVGWFVA